MRKPLFLVLAFIFMTCAFTTVVSANSVNEFRVYPIDLFVEAQYGSTYWRLPELEQERAALAAETINTHGLIADFLERKLSEREAYDALIKQKEKLTLIMKQAFAKLPPDATKVFTNDQPLSREENRKLYDYRLPTSAEVDDEKFWREYIRISNIYKSALFTLQDVTFFALAEALTPVEKDCAPAQETFLNLKTSFRILLKDSLERISEALKLPPN